MMARSGGGGHLHGVNSGKMPMSRRWILAAVIAVLMTESSWALPAYADGGEELLERLLENTPAQTGNAPLVKHAGTTASAPPANATASAGRVKPRDAIRLTPDRTEVVRLEQDAASVVVTNPAHAQIMLETPRLLLVMPRTPGSTSLFVLDKNGNSIFERDIIVSGNTKPYVRIRKSCNDNSTNCNTDSYFYCPDGCYEVSTVPANDAAPQLPPAADPLTIDSTPVPGEVTAIEQDRQEPEPLPVMDDASGLDTDELEDLSTQSQTGEEEIDQ